MFSIAAINESDSGGKWEPLAPTKEAQEFHLSQTYHEGLLKLQDKDYIKARELLESVLKDPIISSAQVGNVPSDRHLLQLRFLSLKNLATVFLQLGPMHYENALHCYLQATELDETDSVVWNHLGTLSCKMGLLSTSRWAFEQGLLCSPNNWNCMEKLLEVLIAIGDEVACLSVANLILGHWPSHSRALHAKETIEDSEPVNGKPFAARGIDKLEPKHVRLEFPEKRKLEDNEISNISKCKKRKLAIELQLTGATWSALIDAILGIFHQSATEDSVPGFMDDHDCRRNENFSSKPGKGLSGDGTSNCRSFGIQTIESMGRFSDVKIDIHLNEFPEITIDPAKGKDQGLSPVGGSASLGLHVLEKTTIVKEKDSSTDREHPQERRSTRIERLRSRKSGKEESEASGKNQANIVFQILEPFVLRRSRIEDHPCTFTSDGTSPDNGTYNSEVEHKDVVQFVYKISKNSGAHHVVHLLLEEVAYKHISFQDSFVKLLELEKLTRNWGQDRSPLCSLFLAEIYYDLGSWVANRSKQLEYLSEASYHLCKVIELVVFDGTNDLIGTDNHFSNTQTMMEMNDIKGGSLLADEKVEKQSMFLSNTSGSSVGEANLGDSLLQGKNEHDSTITDDTAFWVRFFWLSGRLSLFEDSKAKAFNEFCICLTLLRNNKKLEEASDFVFLPHCKLMRLITVDRILHQINLLKLDSLLGKSSDEMMDKGMFMECMNMLSPLLLSTKEVYLDIMFGPLKEKDRNMPMELSALNLLISACEKTEQMDLQVYLNCHRRKLQMLTVAAGMESPILSRGKTRLLKSCGAYEVDLADPINKTWKVLVSEEVKDISRTVTRVKNFIDQGGYNDDFSSLVCVISDIQLLLLTVMCSAIRTIVSQKFSSSVTSGQTDQLESWCLVDAATAFCKLQHLDSFVSIKTQVDLIVAVHDLLADYGLCSSGRDSEGEEGKFLKFAIKHLLALDVKFKQLTGANGQEEPASPHKHPQEIVSVCNVTYDEGEKGDDALHTGKRAELDSTVQESHNTIVGDTASSLPDEEIEEIELTLDTALDQSFFCLYGLKLNLDSSNEDELAIHKNTNRGEYQTKEQCADVFHYLLPYAKALSRAGLVKLRRVLRAIRKHFPQPPDDVLCENAIDKFLDGVDLWEDKLQEVSGLGEGHELITNIISNARDLETTQRSSIVSSEQYLEVYGNLYYFIAQAEEISAIDKYAGFVLKKEGEEFVEQSANLFKYDLLYNPLRFESWQKLANIYDEEVDLLLNDGSKHISVLDWKKNTALHQRVEAGRRRSRRCLLMSLALASTPSQQSQIHELLALVYYDSLQSVVPFYDQRSIAPTKESSWMEFCKNSMKHFEKAFVLKSEWLHAFYLGKLCQKMGQSPVKALSYFNKAALLNPSGVDPVYRMHASRMKLLYSHGYEKIDILQAVAAHVFHQSTRETILDMFQMSNEDLMQFTADTTDVPVQDDLQKRKNIDPKILEKAWHILYDDCLAALRICVEGELKHFHKARYILAKGLYRRGESGDVERAKEELSFCFKSSRSSFTVNMWEIDGMARKGRRKNPGLAGNKKCLELSLSESSRKFITCVRKYLLFYLNLLEKTGELSTLERAYSYIKTDKRFALCLGDIIPVALGKYIQVLISSIRNTENYSGKNNSSLMEQMLEKLFNIFMDHANMWTDIITLPELKMADLSESNLYSYIHQYIHLLETDIRLDALEAINERIRKRFKNPKLTNNNLAKICKHASLAWCRSIAIKLALITPLTDTREFNHKPGNTENSLLLFIDLQPDELMVSQSEGTFQSKGLDMNWFEALCKIKNVQIRQALEENMEAAVALMKCTYSFYRDSSCGTLPMGINLYTTCFSQPSVEGLQQQGKEMVNILDLSIPRKLLLWAYTLVHGRYSNISTVVKYFEDARARMKRGTVLATTSPASVPTAAATVTHAASGACREKPEGNEHAEAEDTTLCSAALHSEETVRVCVPALSEAQKSAAGSSQLQRCSTTKSDENTDGWSGS